MYNWLVWYGIADYTENHDGDVKFKYPDEDFR